MITANQAGLFVAAKNANETSQRAGFFYEKNIYFRHSSIHRPNRSCERMGQYAPKNGG
jgi:hypothetical protein